MMSNQTPFTRISIGRGTGSRNIIISANKKIKSGLFMNWTDSENDGHVLHVRKHYSNRKTRAHI